MFDGQFDSWREGGMTYVVTTTVPVEKPHSHTANIIVLVSVHHTLQTVNVLPNIAITLMAGGGRNDTFSAPVILISGIKGGKIDCLRASRDVS